MVKHQAWTSGKSICLHTNFPLNFNRNISKYHPIKSEIVDKTSSDNIWQFDVHRASSNLKSKHIKTYSDVCTIFQGNPWHIHVEEIDVIFYIYPSKTWINISPSQAWFSFNNLDNISSAASGNINIMKQLFNNIFETKPLVNPFDFIEYIIFNLKKIFWG